MKGPTHGTPRTNHRNPRTARALECIADELDRINAKHNHHMKEPTR